MPCDPGLPADSPFSQCPVKETRLPHRHVKGFPADFCEPCGRRGRYNVERLIAEHGDAKLTDLLQTLADCPKARSVSVYDRCKAVYEGL